MLVVAAAGVRSRRVLIGETFRSLAPHRIPRHAHAASASAAAAATADADEKHSRLKLR